MPNPTPNPILIRTKGHGERIAAALYLGHLIKGQPTPSVLESEEWLLDFTIVGLELENKYITAHRPSGYTANKVIIDFTTLFTYNNITDLNAFFNPPPPPPKPLFKVGDKVMLIDGGEVYTIVYIQKNKYGLLLNNYIQDNIDTTSNSLQGLTDKLIKKFKGLKLVK